MSDQQQGYEGQDPRAASADSTVTENVVQAADTLAPVTAGVGGSPEDVRAAAGPETEGLPPYAEPHPISTDAAPGDVTIRCEAVPAQGETLAIGYQHDPFHGTIEFRWKAAQGSPGYERTVADRAWQFSGLQAVHEVRVELAGPGWDPAQEATGTVEMWTAGDGQNAPACLGQITFTVPPAAPQEPTPEPQPTG